jgi:N-acetyl-gamma-glutamylphosphate reductase
MSFVSTGVTGYIAGDAFSQLYEEHPNYEYSLLIRTKDKADKVQQTYKNVRIVLGGLDDSSLLEEEAANTDIVLRASVEFLLLMNHFTNFESGCC